MATLADTIKKLGVTGIERSSYGLFIKYGEGQRTNPNNRSEQKSLFEEVFGTDFTEQLYGGQLDPLMQDGVLTGSLNEEGTFDINMDLGSVEGGGGSLEFLDPVQEGTDQVAPETGIVENSGGSSPASASNGATTTGGSTATSSQDFTMPTLSTGTGSAVDRQLQLQSQLAGQQAYKAGEENRRLLDGLQSQVTQLGDLSSILGGLFSSNFKNEDFGLGQNFARQQALRKAGRGTASTKVKDSSVQQAVLQQPTLLKG